VIYLTSTFVLFALASWIFYHATERNIYQQQMRTLQLEAKHLLSLLRRLHLSDAPQLIYPKTPSSHSAMFDIDRQYIFGDFPQPPSLDAPPPEGELQFVVQVEPYYLGAAHLLVQRPFNDAPLCALRRNIFFYMIGGGVLFALLGYFLGRLFIAPMRESVEQMNRFIEDTTHELNTPIATILANVEMIEALERGLDVRQELGRIEIASRTLSRIYDDLSYLSLKHPYHREVVEVEMSALVAERLDYFAMMAEAKQLKMEREIAPDVRRAIDLNDAMRLIDNLLSNAIKYNRIGGTLRVTLDADRLVVSDTGVGIPTDKIATLHERFRRANTSEGGFGIGLNIVHQVVQHYGFGFAIESEENQGTEVTVTWN
jgi:two-component system OmpR family sensor kinase